MISVFGVKVTKSSQNSHEILFSDVLSEYKYYITTFKKEKQSRIFGKWNDIISSNLLQKQGSHLQEKKRGNRKTDIGKLSFPNGSRDRLK